MANDVQQKPVDAGKQFELMLTKMQGQIQNALPKFLTPKRMTRIALTEFRLNEQLRKCDPASVISAIVVAAQVGIEVGSVLGQGYLVPYGNQCQFILGYKGMLDLARRSGNILSLSAHVVHENDEFDFELGLNEVLRHKPAHNNRGAIVGAYAIARFKDGGHQIMYMTKEQIDKIKDCSKMKNAMPWTKFYDEMARKTVIRNLFKYLPISVEMRDAYVKDLEAEEGLQDNSNIFDHEPMETPKKSRAEQFLETVNGVDEDVTDSRTV